LTTVFIEQTFPACKTTKSMLIFRVDKSEEITDGGGDRENTGRFIRHIMYVK